MAATRSALAHRWAIQPVGLPHLKPRPNHDIPAGELRRCSAPGKGPVVGYVVRMIQPMVRVLTTCRLISSRNLDILFCMLMSVKLLRSGQPGLMRFDKCCETV